MSIKLAIRGDLRVHLQEQAAATRRAAAKAVEAATEKLKQDLRAETRRAGLGQRLGNTWRSRFYANRSDPRGPAGLVWSKAPHIVRGFEEGTTIRARHGRYLAIPTDAVIRRRGRKLSPHDFEEAGIPLRFVPPSGSRPALLVAENFVAGRRPGTWRVATERRRKQGRGLTTVIMYVLVRQVRLPKRTSFAPIVGRIGSDLFDLLEVAMTEEGLEG